MAGNEATPLTVQKVHLWPGAEPRYTVVSGDVRGGDVCIDVEYTVGESVLRGAR